MAGSKLKRWMLKRFARPLRANGYVVTQDRYSISYLRKYGFRISTLVDVGVLDGTPVFYNLFASSKIVMVDPLPDIHDRCAAWLANPTLNIEIINAAAGAGEGIANLRVADAYSGLLDRIDGRGTVDGVLPVRVASLDDLLAEKGITGPFGLKIDTEGYELPVIEGAKETLRNTEFVFAEVSIRKRFAGSYSFSEMVAAMRDNGFEVADLVPNPSHNRHADVLFVRADSPSLNVGAVALDRI